LDLNIRNSIQAQLDFANKRIAFLESPLPIAAINGAFANHTDHLAEANIDKTVVLRFNHAMDAMHCARQVAADIERRQS